MPQLVDILRAIHVLDIILFLMIVGFAFLGFTRGALKLFFIVASIYLGFVIGAIYYLPAAQLLEKVLRLAPSTVTQILAFVLLDALVSVLLIVLLFQFFGHMEIEGRVGACVDRPIGMLLGFGAGILLAAILVILLEVPYDLNTELQATGTSAPYMILFHDWYANSYLGPVLVRGLPYLLASMAPLLGGQSPPILTAHHLTGTLPVWIAWLGSLRG